MVTPKRCGLYETTREVVKALRDRGVDSRLVDPTDNKLHPGGDDDRGAKFGSMDWAVTADVIVNHSGYDGTLVAKTDQPIVHVVHGRPLSSFKGEAAGSTPIYSYHYRRNTDPRWRSVVTFWKEHEDYLKVMLPDKPVRVVQGCVDLDAWTPQGPSGYAFGGKGGAINVVCSDAFRADVDPFVPLNTFALWAREHQGAKLHLYGKSPQYKKGWDAIIQRITDDGNMGECMGWVNGLEHVYRAADVVLSAHEIEVRTIKEAMASGCPVAQLSSLRPELIDEALETVDARAQAVARWNPTETARQFHIILAQACHSKPG